MTGFTSHNGIKHCTCCVLIIIHSLLDFTTELCKPQNTEEKEKEGKATPYALKNNKTRCYVVPCLM